MPEKNDIATLITTVETLTTKLTKKVSAIEEKVGKIEVVDPDYKTQMGQLTSKVKELDERGDDWKADKENLSAMLNDIMEKQIAKQNAQGVLWPDKSVELGRRMGLPDPNDPALVFGEFDELDHSELIQRDIEAAKAADGSPFVRKGMEAIIKLPGISDEHRAVARMGTNVRLLNGMGLMAWMNEHGDAGRQTYPGFAAFFPKYAKHWRRYQLRYLQNFVSKADGDLMDTITEVSDWVPTGFDAEIHELIKMELLVADAFQTFPFPGGRSPWKPNIDLTDIEGNFMPETIALSGADPFSAAEQLLLQKITTGTPPTFTARKMRGRMIRSGEADEDTVVALLPFLQRKLVRILAENKERATINGQRTSTIDTADVPGANDVRKAFDGLRWHVEQMTGAKVDAGGTNPSAADFLSNIPKAMKEFGIVGQSIAIPSKEAFFRMIIIPEVIKVNEYGPNATILRGELASLGKYPIIPSRNVRADLTTAGIFDNVTKTKTVVVFAHLEAFAYATLRQVTLEVQRWAATDANDLIAFERYDFQNWFGTGFNSAAVLHNIAN